MTFLYSRTTIFGYAVKNTVPRARTPIKAAHAHSFSRRNCYRKLFTNITTAFGEHEPPKTGLKNREEQREKTKRFSSQWWSAYISEFVTDLASSTNLAPFNHPANRNEKTTTNASRLLASIITVSFNAPPAYDTAGRETVLAR